MPLIGHRSPMHLLLLLLFWCSGFQTASGPATQSQITVQCAPPVVRRVPIDPSRTHSGSPTTHPNEAAITLQLDCRVKLDGEILSKSQRPDGQWQITARVVGGRIELALEDVIYLPMNATLPLRIHEEGHREINERLYRAKAEAIALRAATQTVARDLTNSAADPDAALGEAITEAEKQIRQRTQRTFVEQAQHIADRFDRITNHGQRDVDPREAIDWAFQEN